MNEDPHRIVADAAGAVDRIEQTNHTAPLAGSQPAATTPARDETARGFLRLILPAQGPYVAMIRETGGRKYNVFAETIEELWSIIRKADDAGHTAYHACAAFQEARRDPRNTPPAKRQFGRTKRNVRAA